MSEIKDFEKSLQKKYEDDEMEEVTIKVKDICDAARKDGLTVFISKNDSVWKKKQREFGSLVCDSSLKELLTLTARKDFYKKYAEREVLFFGQMITNDKPFIVIEGEKK